MMESWPAPGGDGFGDAIEETLVGMEGEFIEGDMTAFAGEGVGAGGEGIDAATVGELEDAGGGFGILVKEHFADVAEADVQQGGPVAAIFEGEAGLIEVAGADVGVQPSIFGADQLDEAIGVAPGEAGLAGFDDDFERGVVENPVALGEVEKPVEVGVHKWFRGLRVGVGCRVSGEEIF